MYMTMSWQKSLNNYLTVQPESNGLSDSDMELLQFLKSLTPEMKEMLLKQSASK